MSEDGFYLKFGALAPTLEKQLGEQGIVSMETALWQGWANSITHLAIAGILTEAETDRARKRIVKTIIKRIQKHGC